MTVTALEEIMRGRRSIRTFTPQVPSRDLVEAVLELAITAPSASNNQPWRFFVSDQAPIIEAMASAVEDAVEAVAQSLESDHLQAFRDYGDYFVRFRQAPVVIVPAYHRLRLLSHLCQPTPLIDRLEEHSALISTSLAVQNLLLACHDRGLGTSCLTGPLLAAPQIEGILNIPAGWSMALVVALGYPAENPGQPPRKPVSKVVRWVEGAPGAKANPKDS